MGAVSGAVARGAAACLPLGRRTPRGRLRWYLARVPEGREAALCARLRRLVPGDLLEDAFLPRKERWAKRSGAWSTEAVAMHPGYIFLASRDAAALDRALSRLTLPVSLVGAESRSWAPLDEAARAWLESALDATYTLRSSTASILGGELVVHEGPLVGQESLVKKVDRHRRTCLVSVPGSAGGFTESLPLDVPVKR